MFQASVLGLPQMTSAFPSAPPSAPPSPHHSLQPSSAQHFPEARTASPTSPPAFDPTRVAHGFLTNYHKLSGFPGHVYSLQFRRPESNISFTGLKSRHRQDWFLLEAPGKNPFPCTSQSLELCSLHFLTRDPPFRSYERHIFKSLTASVPSPSPLSVSCP